MQSGLILDHSSDRAYVLLVAARIVYRILMSFQMHSPVSLEA